MLLSLGALTFHLPREAAVCPGLEWAEVLSSVNVQPSCRAVGADGGATTGRSFPMAMAVTVKFFNGERGYGFIKPDDGGRDVFVHITAVERAGLKSLNEGQRIGFDVEPDKKGKGPKAGNLVVTGWRRRSYGARILRPIDPRGRLPASAAAGNGVFPRNGYSVADAQARPITVGPDRRARKSAAPLRQASFWQGSATHDFAFFPGIALRAQDQDGGDDPRPRRPHRGRARRYGQSERYGACAEPARQDPGARARRRPRPVRLARHPRISRSPRRRRPHHSGRADGALCGAAPAGARRRHHGCRDPARL